MTRVALAGCGAMGEIVARTVYPALGGLAAAIDPDPARAAAVAELTGARPFTSLAEARREAGIDAVDVRVPHHLHAAVVLEALASGCHVLVEKPFATTLSDAHAMVAAADDAGLVLAVAENYPHLRAVLDARTALAAGQIGDVVALRSTRAYQVGGVWVRDGWRHGGGPSGGILLDQGTHQVSLLRRLGGPVAAVAAAGDDDTVALTLRMASGVTAQSLLTWSVPGAAAQAEATVLGTGGRLDVVVDYDADEGGCHVWTPAGSEHTGKENYYDSHRLMVEDWLAAIRAGAEPVVPGREGRADLAVVLAATESLERGGGFVEVP
ncbi:Gfo/Idh/MocA family oxidoreductase [Amycolatopsis sp. NBC_01307]|uniref:Gfo/Idh/MocA family protein n=1 Tax=Amycolatopsis sp. NBC_01307 TaxID=2903561 RepID=UPI002E0FF576|nr:Gfo/Idh/MocA family oxidoreductase [Amycolatopsis sp. NBC_01307]